MLNRKKLYRLYREERLTVRKRGGRKRALGTRAPMAIPQGPNQRWSLDFVSDALASSRRFRILTVVDDFSRECLALVVDNSLSGGVSEVLCKSGLCDCCGASELTPWGQFAGGANRSPNWIANWLIAAVHAMGRRQWTSAFLIAR